MESEQGAQAPMGYGTSVNKPSQLAADPAWEEKQNAREAEYKAKELSDNLQRMRVASLEAALRINSPSTSADDILSYATKLLNYLKGSTDGQ